MCAGQYFFISDVQHWTTFKIVVWLVLCWDSSVLVSLCVFGGGGGGAGQWSGAGRAVRSLFMLGVSLFFLCLDFVVGRFCGELNDAVNCCTVWWNYTIKTHVSACIYIYIYIHFHPHAFYL